MMIRMIFIFLASITIYCSPAAAQTLRVATYNMRNDNAGDSVKGNGWRQRLPVIGKLVQFHDFDVFGTQECKSNQLEDLQRILKDYSYIGIGRDDGLRAGEFSAIFYKTAMFTLLKKGDFWMAPVTDKPTKGWDAALPRICTWGQFRDKTSKRTFYLFNLHMDHIGVTARKESAKLVLQKIKELAGDAPVILTGDFNVDQNNESYTLINNSGVLQDSYVKSPVVYATNGTFNNFNADAYTESRIDHIFVSKEFTVKRYGILTDSYRMRLPDSTATDGAATARSGARLNKYAARLPSDHFPVMVELARSR